MSMAIVRLSNRALTVVCLSFDLKPYGVRCLRYLYCIFDICGKCEANSYLLMHYCWVLFPLPWNNLFTNFNGKKVGPSRVLEGFLIEDDVCNPMRTAYFKTIWQLCLRVCQYYFHILYVLAHAIFAFINILLIFIYLCQSILFFKERRLKQCWHYTSQYSSMWHYCESFMSSFNMFPWPQSLRSEWSKSMGYPSNKMLFGWRCCQTTIPKRS